MERDNTAKKHATHAFSQFRLTNYLLNNLSQFKLTPTAKLVLLELSTCYNPNKLDMFPKQKTLAHKIGVSERSVVRAVQELLNEKLIIIEYKYSNRYRFTSNIGGEWSVFKNFYVDKMSEDKGQNDSLKDDKLSPHDIEPIKEPIKEPTRVEDFKILKNYAIKHGAKNINAYIKKLESNGSSKEIIENYRNIHEKEQNYKEWLSQETLKRREYYKKIKENTVPPESCEALQKWLEQRRMRKNNV